MKRPSSMLFDHMWSTGSSHAVCDSATLPSIWICPSRSLAGRRRIERPWAFATSRRLNRMATGTLNEAVNTGVFRPSMVS